MESVTKNAKMGNLIGDADGVGYWTRKFMMPGKLRETGSSADKVDCNDCLKAAATEVLH